MATQAIPGSEPTYAGAGIPDSLRSRFDRLADQWSEETEFVSSSSAIVLNGAYQQIIGMGQAAIPLILRRLESEEGHWFWALKHITGEDPVLPQKVGKFEKMREIWLTWGRECRYLTIRDLRQRLPDGALAEAAPL